jgi:hypothetical protein
MNNLIAGSMFDDDMMTELPPRPSVKNFNPAAILKHLTIDQLGKKGARGAPLNPLLTRI